MFDPVDPKQRFPDLERAILRYWQEEDTFKRSICGRIVEDTNKKRTDDEDTQYSFYDGPPFATGLPHYGHLLAGTIKDVIPRYQTMKGKRVQRRFGWDCHGLPVEYEIEKAHNLTKDDIEAMGTKAFNDLCRGIVQTYTKEWRTTVERMGRWVDMDWDYRTMDPEYMESIWWGFAELHKKGLVYEGHKPMHICPRCVTPLSNFEVTQGYKEVTDLSAVVKFRVKESEESDERTYFLAWTTTPWTLPGNVFLAVKPDVQYVKFSIGSDDENKKGMFIASEQFFQSLQSDEKKDSGDTVTAIETVQGSALIGMTYEPLFPYFADQYPDAFRVVAGDFVTTEDGTGIVHIAPGFGEDDFNVGKREGAKMLQHVTMEGKFTNDVTDFAGMEVKPKDKPTSTDQKINLYLQQHGKLFEQKSYTHTYPHCWRCDTPLLNYATSSWFVSVEKIKDTMLKNNAKTEWVPAHIRDGRFGKWIENAHDWSVSRNRYWGTPVPIWRNDETGELAVIGSRDDLVAKDPQRFTKITVARHAESEGNLAPIYQAEVPGTPLTKNGQAQAKDLAKKLKGQRIHHVYASPLDRAMQTAQIVAKAAKAEMTVDDRLREVSFGEYEGKTVDFTDLSFVRAKRAKQLDADAVESIYHFPGMETWSQVSARLLPLLKEILATHKGEHVLVVTHADLVQHVRNFFTGEEPRKLVNQPYPSFAEPYTFYWDHRAEGPLDLHKEIVDDISWTTGTDADAVTLTVVRHAQSDWNIDERIAGATDRPLSNKGRDEAAALRQQLNANDYDVILTSDLQRTQETARIATSGWGKEIAIEPLFREQDLGEWEGKILEEVRKEHPEYPQNFLKDVAIIPGGENRRDFLRRVREAVLMLREKYKGKRVLLFTHRRWICALRHVELGAPIWEPIVNTHHETMMLRPTFRRVGDVFDCWVESGSMPFAQSHYPFESYETPRRGVSTPPGFPADFIAEGVDQTRGWFYTLTVLSNALFDRPAFHHCIVNGTVLAEDGKKMSKRLKNYPEPLEVVERHGADAVRFALMSSPAVRAEDVRFSEKTVEETVRNVLLPLWNTYSFFVTYANAAGWEPAANRRVSAHPLDQWIRAETQDLVNRMTNQLDRYDLSATCAELNDTIDALTNWYIRLSRRRFAGKSALQEQGPIEGGKPEEQADALATLYDVLLTVTQLLAPFCPFLTEQIYLNLVAEEHGSVHLTQWPAARPLEKEELATIEKNRLLRRIVSLGLFVRSEKKIKVRQPLQKVLIAIPDALRKSVNITQDDLTLLRDELNVKDLEFVDDPGSLAQAVAMVDARKVGPRVGGKVQELIQAGKRGEFTQDGDAIVISGERLSADEAKIVYRSKEGDTDNVAADHGVVVSLDVSVTPELQLEGAARDLIRAIQKERKEAGLQLQDRISLKVEGADELLATHSAMIERETNAMIGNAKGTELSVEIDGKKVRFWLEKI